MTPTARVLCAALVVTVALTACGGGDSASNTPPPARSSATVTIDPALRTAGAVSIVAVQSLTDEQPTGSGVSYPTSQAEWPLYAIDSSGEIVLAARPLGGAATFTAASTVQIYVATLLSTFRPQDTLSELELAVSAAPGFVRAVEAFSDAYARGVNPPTDPPFKVAVQDLMQHTLQNLT